MQEQYSFFADENIPPELIDWFRETGYKITSVREQNLSGIDDKQIIDLAFENKLIIANTRQ